MSGEIIPIGDYQKRRDREAWQADRIRHAMEHRETSDGLYRWSAAILGLALVVALAAVGEPRDTRWWWIATSIAAILLLAGAAVAICGLVESRRSDRYFR